MHPSVFPAAIPNAILNALHRANVRLEDVGCFEINEAFAAVPILVMNKLNIPRSKVNILGGALAIGHPLGASGVRIIGSLVTAMESINVRYGCAAICNGGGGGTAVILERNLS